VLFRSPGFEKDITAEEKELQKVYNLSIEQLQWRRWKIHDMIDSALFPQEYPLNPMEAFISSGRKVFDAKKLQQMFNMREEPKITGDLFKDKDGTPGFIRRDRGFLKIWKPPEDGEYYCVGADVAGGSDYIEPESSKDKTAFSAAEVRNRKTWEVAATFNCKLEVDAYGDYLNLLGRLYNNAILGVEFNNMGIAVIKHLVNICKYPNLFMHPIVDELTLKITKKLGWHTTSKTKPLMIADQNKALRDGSLKLNSEQSIRQHLSYVYDKHNKAKPQPGTFADLVIASCIATQICQMFPISSGEHKDIVDDRERSTGGSGYG